MLGYFESPFFLRVWSEGYNNRDASLTWTLECPRRNYSSDAFSLPSWLRQGSTGRASLRTGSSSDRPKAQPTCYSGPVPTIAPQNSGFDLPSRRKAGVLTFMKDETDEFLVRARGLLLLTRHNLRCAAIYSRQLYVSFIQRRDVDLTASIAP